MAVGVDIELQVKIDKLRAELEKIPGISAKESKKMAAAWSRDYKRMEADAAKAARAAERSAEKVREGWKSAGERTASLMGGVFGDISDSVLGLGGRMGDLSDEIGGTSGAMVGMTGIAAGLSAAAIFGAHAFLEWMDTIEETRKSLELVQGTPPLTPEHEEALDRYVEVSKQADAVSAALALRLQADLAPAATDMQLAFVGLSSSVSSFSESGLASGLWSIHEALQMMNGPQVLVNAAWDYMVGVGEDVTEQITLLTDEQVELNRVMREGSDEIRVTNDELNAYAEALGYVRETYVDLDRAAKDRADAARVAAAEAKRQAEEEAAAFQGVVDSLVESLDSMVAYEAQLAKIEQQSTEAADSQRESFDAAAEGWQRLSQDASDYANVLEERVKKQQAESIEELITMSADLVETAMKGRLEAIVEEERAADRLAEKRKKDLETQKELIQSRIESGKISAQEGEAEIARIDAQLEAERAADRKRRKDARDARLEGHKAWKAAAIARAAIDAAANAVALTAAFVPIAGPLAPAVATAAALAQFELQRAEINKVKPPKFATGGLVRDRIEGDHAMVYAEPSEGILTPRGVETVGGRQGLEAINRGQLPGGSGGTMVYLDSRLLGEVVARVVESDQRVTAALERRVGAIPGVRR
jgi:hypothetical protein